MCLRAEIYARDPFLTLFHIVFQVMPSRVSYNFDWKSH